MAPPPDVGRSSINGGRQRTIVAGLEPATVGSEVQRSSIEPRDLPLVGLEPTIFGLGSQRLIH